MGDIKTLKDLMVWQKSMVLVPIFISVYIFSTDRIQKCE